MSKLNRIMDESIEPPNFRESHGPEKCKNCANYTTNWCSKFMLTVYGESLCDVWTMRTDPDPDNKVL